MCPLFWPPQSRSTDGPWYKAADGSETAEYHGWRKHNFAAGGARATEAPMASLTVENYVKTIYQLAGEAATPAVATGQIAAALGVLPGTVTSMLKTLAESNLATYTPYEGVRLTPAGSALALRVVRRHRLIEL